jgi:hypothetical protein
MGNEFEPGLGEGQDQGLLPDDEETLRDKTTGLLQNPAFLAAIATAVGTGALAYREKQKIQDLIKEQTERLATKTPGDKLLRALRESKESSTIGFAEKTFSFLTNDGRRKSSRTISSFLRRTGETEQEMLAVEQQVSHLAAQFGLDDKVMQQILQEARLEVGKMPELFVTELRKNLIARGLVVVDTKKGDKNWIDTQEIRKQSWPFETLDNLRHDSGKYPPSYLAVKYDLEKDTTLTEGEREKLRKKLGEERKIVAYVSYRVLKPQDLKKMDLSTFSSKDVDREQVPAAKLEDMTGMTVMLNSMGTGSNDDRLNTDAIYAALLGFLDATMSFSAFNTAGPGFSETAVRKQITKGGDYARWWFDATDTWRSFLAIGAIQQKEVNPNFMEFSVPDDELKIMVANDKNAQITTDEDNLLVSLPLIKYQNGPAIYPDKSPLPIQLIKNEDGFVTGNKVSVPAGWMVLDHNRFGVDQRFPLSLFRQRRYFIDIPI